MSKPKSKENDIDCLVSWQLIVSRKLPKSTKSSLYQRIEPATLDATLCLIRGKNLRNELFPDPFAPTNRVIGLRSIDPVETRFLKFFRAMLFTTSPAYN